jgi:hypothetical protein
MKSYKQLKDLLVSTQTPVLDMFNGHNIPFNPNNIRQALSDKYNNSVNKQNNIIQILEQLYNSLQNQSSTPTNTQTNIDF